MVGQAVSVGYSIAVTAPGSGTPAGNVTVTDGVDSCSASVADGSCSITLHTQGPHTLTATFAGDTNFNGSTSPGMPQAVHQSPAITSADNVIYVATRAGTFTVTATGYPAPALSVLSSPALPATITFVDNGDGTATLSGTPTPADEAHYTLTISATNAAGTATQTFALTLDSAPVDTTTTITSVSPSSSVVGGTVTINFQVSPDSFSVNTPVGNVTVTDGTHNCTASVAVGTCTITYTAPGAHTLTATYEGSLHFNPSPVSAGVGHTVLKADTTAAITSNSPHPSLVGQTVTFNYSVSVNAPGAGTLTGTVTVSDGTDSCTAALAAGTCQITLATAGTHSFAATYSGDGNFNASPASAGVGQVVEKADTTSAIPSQSQNPTAVGQPVTFNYSILVTAPGAGIPTGTVTIGDGTDSCTATVAAGSCVITFGTTGTNDFTAIYSGDDNFNASPASPSISHRVGKAGTTTHILSDLPDPSLLGQAVTVSYSVSVNAPATGTPTGNVTVSDGTDSCTDTVGAGSCALTLTGTGIKTLTAAYQGDGDFNASTSAGSAHTVDQAPVITSANHTFFAAGNSVSFVITTTGYPIGAGMTIGETGSLPDGISFQDNHDGTATLAGTPTLGTGGIYNLTLTAGNGVSPDATQDFTLSVDSLPTDITLSSSSVSENRVIGTAVAGLTTTDADAGDGHTYSLVNGGGSCPGTNNLSFQIGGNKLLTTAVFDYETKASYVVCVRSDDGRGGVFQKAFTITVTDLPETFTSVGSQDGWILESTETSNKGGSLNSTTTTFQLGDDAIKRQYRSILSFNTATLPDNAIVQSAVLKIKSSGSPVGANPFTVLGKLLLDIRKGFFGTTSALQVGDFDSAATAVNVGSFNSTPSAGWYSVSLSAIGRADINKVGPTQFRLHFTLDDNNNNVANYLKFLSGNATTGKPVLTLIYTVP